MRRPTWRLPESAPWLPTLRLVREGPRQEGARRITGAPGVYGVLQPYFEREPVEVFWILMLDTQGKLIGDAPVEITRGIINSTLVHAREVFRPAIMAGASAIVVAHNHPSGEVQPTVDDDQITKQLREAGAMLDLPVKDHVIIGNGRYYSYAEQGRS